MTYAVSQEPEDAIDDGRLGRSIGKSADVNSGETEGPTGTMHCSTGGGSFGVLGAVLRTAFGLDEGAGLSIGRLFVGVRSGIVLAVIGAGPDELEPAEPPIICMYVIIVLNDNWLLRLAMEGESQTAAWYPGLLEE